MCWRQVWTSQHSCWRNKEGKNNQSHIPLIPESSFHSYINMYFPFFTHTWYDGTVYSSLSLSLSRCRSFFYVSIHPLNYCTCSYSTTINLNNIIKADQRELIIRSLSLHTYTRWDCDDGFWWHRTWWVGRV